MNPFIAEFIGTCILMVLGAGVVANVSLKNTAGEKDPKWILITIAWGFAVFVGVFISGEFSGAHLNPAVSVGLAMVKKFDWALVPMYVFAQTLGAMFGSWLNYQLYYDHFQATSDENTIRGCFCTAPMIKNTPRNLFSEIYGTFFLVFAIFFIAKPDLQIEGVDQIQYGIGSLDALPVGILVWVIGMSLGGTTGYAINPARDFGPRLVYAIIRRKQNNANWSYAWIPVVGPLLGGVLAGIVFNLLN
ncbi:MAG: aquaporin family protein [Crocinitomicaceae bacterium]|nr:aquaporin family protein [Crocinitomicaceae bacterium]